MASVRVGVFSKIEYAKAATLVEKWELLGNASWFGRINDDDYYKIEEVCVES